MAKADPRRQYEQWVSAYAPELYRFAYRLSGKHQVAEDLLQETFVEAWRSVEKQREPGKERAWLYQILRYRYAHYLRDRKQEPQMAALEDDMAAARRAAPAMEALAERESLETALGLLAPEIRETFLMVFMQGYKCREAADDLHVPIGTVLSRLSRARESLRKSLGGERLRGEGGRKTA
ncbi:MAG TPA: RNA polymerase sigma factor [Phycisphaerae bacterium]|jgi:RNA polymerase sigma-70 factor (ECF subfamily)|nr:RNA polymerase sigma factor [Phycisphaerae bacterium]